MQCHQKKRSDFVRDREIFYLTILADQADAQRISEHRAVAAAFAVPQFEASIDSLRSQLEIPGLSSESRIDIQGEIVDFEARIAKCKAELARRHSHAHAVQPP